MRVLSAFLLLVTVAVFATCVSVHANDEPATAVDMVAFSAATFFTGEWDVYRHTISYGSSSVNYEHSLPVARWHLEKENTSTNLFGRGWVNGSESDSFAMKVEFHDYASGKFQTGSDEDNLSTLFHFSFSQIKASIPISVGAWNGAEIAVGNEATYMFQASSPDRFTILVTPTKSADLAKAAQASGKAPKKPVSDDDEDLSSAGPASTGHPVLSAAELAGQDSYLIVGHRIKAEGEKTFFQKYGTMFLLGAMLLVNVYMRTKQSANSYTAKQSAARASAIATGNPPSRLASKKPTGATIEEIDEGTINVKKDK